MKMKNTANNDSPGPDFDFGPDAAHAAERIACLAGFMTPERYAVLRKTVSMRTRYMTVLAENMYHGQNAAALIRHCEAFGVQEMHTVETLCPFEPNPDIARGTHQWVDVRRHASTGEAVAALKGAGYRIVATTPHREDATPGTFRAGLRDGTRRDFRRGDRFGRRIPAHPDVRHGREPERLGLGGDPDLHALRAHAPHGRQLADVRRRTGRNALPLDAAQREGFRSDFATPGYGPGFIGGFGAPGPNPRKWIK